jgi:hypothetical protein
VGVSRKFTVGKGFLLALLLVVIFCFARYRMTYNNGFDTLWLSDRANPKTLCAISWSDVGPLCSQNLAIWLDHVGFARGNAARFRLYQIDRGRVQSIEAINSCETDRIVHIGNAGTTVAIGTHVYYLEPNDPRDPDALDRRNSWRALGSVVMCEVLVNKHNRAVAFKTANGFVLPFMLR